MEDPNEWNKDKRTRERIKKCNKQVGDFVYMVLGDESYTNRNWDRKTELVKSSMERIKDPQFLLEKLTSVIMENESSSLDFKKAESALQELKLFFHQSKDMVPDQDFTNGTHESRPDSILQNQNEGLQIQGTAVQWEIEEVLEEEELRIIWRMFCSWLKMIMAECCVLGEDCPIEVQGHHGDKINWEQLRLSFLKNPNSILINEKGKSAEIFNQETNKAYSIGQRLQSDYGRHYMCQAGNSGNYWNLESPVDLELRSLLEDVTVQSYNNQSYKVYSSNAELLTEIFQEHPEIDENFQVVHPDFQSKFMNSLVEIYRKIKECKLEMLEIEDIKSMDVKIQDMVKNGLQLTWLKEMLGLEREKKKRKIREMKKQDEEELAETIKKAKHLTERIKNAEEKLA
ncbi:hypothetical protein PTKIN_Ptkin05aG0030200 [Pterospermum kingtungense]